MFVSPKKFRPAKIPENNFIVDYFLWNLVCVGMVFGWTVKYNFNTK